MADKNDLLDTAERRRFVLQQRKAGKTTRETAQAAIEEFGEDSLPDGWDSRYVSKDVGRVLEKAREEVQELAAEYRTVEISRLETLLSNLWPYASEHTEEVVTDDGEAVEVKRPPDEKKIDRILAIMDRLERLYDIDEAPALRDDSGSETKNIFVQVNQQIESQ